MRPYTINRKRKSRLQLLHQYYSYTGFYTFILQNLKKAILPALLIGAGVFLFDRYVIDVKSMLLHVTETYSDRSVFTVFFLSESFLGLLPPEIFIAWVKTAPQPMLYLSLLALLSYLGGCLSYAMGKGILFIPKVRYSLEVKMAKHIQHIRKWGGFLIVVGALLPIPFSMVSIAAGIISYSFKQYLLFGLFRFLRFYLFALAIFSLL